MQKNAILLLSWVVLVLALGIALYLRFENIMIVGLAVLGSFLGCVLPVFLDVLLPKLMAGEVTLDRTLAADTLREGMSQVRQGNIQANMSVRTPLRSYPLFAAYVLASLFIITSTGSYLGRGFALGLGLSLSLDLWFSRRPIEYLKDRWFSVFHANLSDREFDYFVFGSIGVYTILVLLGILV